MEISEFSARQILREINCRESRGSRTAVFAILEALDFVKFQPSKSAKIHKIQTSEPPNVLKRQIFHF